MSDSHLRAMLKEIEYRVGDYESFVELLQKTARSYEIPDGQYKGSKVFDKTDLDNEDSFLNSIFKSWAAVLEVLTFYQERNVNEGYINTAKEKFSIYQLTESIGYNHPSALSAQTWLAFTVHDKSTLREFIIPNGTQVQNVPDSGMPAIFETVNDFRGSPDWNQISLDIESHYSIHRLRASSSYCQLVFSQKAALKKGHSLIIDATLDGNPVTYLVTITKTDKQKDGSILVYWDHCLDAGNNILEDCKIHLSSLVCRAFAFNSTLWEKVTDKTKQSILPSRACIVASNTGSNTWASYTKTPPPGDILSIIDLGQGQFVAASNKGVWLSSDNAHNWQKSPANNVLGNILCMIIDGSNNLYLGCSKGAVYCSTNLGVTWFSVSGRNYFSIEEKKNIIGRLPQVNINSLANVWVSYKKGIARKVLFCATSKGVFYTLDGGLNWQSGDELFSYVDHDMPKNLLAYELRLYDEVELFLCTEKGFYYATIDEKSLHETADKIKKSKSMFSSNKWHSDMPNNDLFVENNKQIKVFASLALDWQEENIILLATELGVYRLISKAWVLQNKGFLRHLDDSFPRIYSLSAYNNSIYAASDLGLYISKDGGLSWELQVNDLVALLPELTQWVDDFDNGILTSNFREVMQIYGYYFTDKASIEITISQFAWIIHDELSIDVRITKNKHTLTFEFGCSERDVLVLNDQCHYLSLLNPSAALPLEWIEILNVYNVQVSEDATVTEYAELDLVVIQDLKTQTVLAISITSNEIKISHVDSVLSMTSVVDNQFLASTSQAILTLNNWPNYRLNEQTLALDKVESIENLGDVVFLEQDSFWPASQMCQVNDSKVTTINKLGKKARTTVLTLDTVLLQKFDRNSLKVHAKLTPMQPNQFIAHDYKPDENLSLKLIGNITPMKRGHKISIEGAYATLQIVKKFENLEDKNLLGKNAKSGKLTRLKRPFIASVKATDYIGNVRNGFIEHKLNEALAKHGIHLSPSAFLQAQANDSWSVIDSTNVSYYFEFIEKTSCIEVYREYYFPVLAVDKHHYKLLNNGDEILIVIEDKLQFTWINADETIPCISEIATVADFNNNSLGHVRIQLDEKLNYLYDPTTVEVRANVIHAVQGESVIGEIIGSSDQRDTFQRFKLLNKSLTCYETYKGEIDNFLKVFIRRSKPWGVKNNDLEEWKQIGSIFNAGKNERCYQLEITSDGYAHVMFGNGVFGQRLPNGQENVIASYRKGNGSNGNLLKHKLKILRSKPRCVKAVTNPVAATGGVNVSPVDDIRHQAPEQLQYTGVIICRDDYLYFARNFPGVSSAYLADLNIYGKNSLMLTIITADNIDPSQASLDLKKAIGHYQANNTLINVAPAQQEPFSITINIIAEENCVWLDLQQTVKRKLTRQYALKNSCAGTDVESSQLISFVQSIEGVRSAELQNLALISHPDINQCNAKLVALPASYCEVKNIYKGAQVLVSFDAYINVEIGELS